MLTLDEARAGYKSAFDNLKDLKTRNKAVNEKIVEFNDERIPALEASLEGAEAGKFKALDEFAGGRGTEKEVRAAHDLIRDVRNELEGSRELLLALQREQRASGSVSVMKDKVNSALVVYRRAVSFSIMDEILDNEKLKAALRKAYVAWGYPHAGIYVRFLNEVFSDCAPPEDERSAALMRFHAEYIEPITGEKIEAI